MGLKALFTAAKNVVTGVDQYVTEEIRLDRLDKCNNCPRLMVTRQCGACLCFVDLKTKLKQESCPIGKWDAKPE